jgi:hypothetical protein
MLARAKTAGDLRMIDDPNIGRAANCGLLMGSRCT